MNSRYDRHDAIKDNVAVTNADVQYMIPFNPSYPILLKGVITSVPTARK